MNFKILSDGEKDGIVLMYMRDGTIYPVALTKKQAEELDTLINIRFARANDQLTVINHPIGSALNLLSGKGCEER